MTKSRKTQEPDDKQKQEKTSFEFGPPLGEEYLELPPDLADDDSAVHPDSGSSGAADQDPKAGSNDSKQATDRLDEFD